MIGGGVDIEKHNVFAVRQKNGAVRRSLRGKKWRVEVRVQQNRAARFGSRHRVDVIGARQCQQHRDRRRREQNQRSYFSNFRVDISFHMFLPFTISIQIFWDEVWKKVKIFLDCGLFGRRLRQLMRLDPPSPRYGAAGTARRL